MKKNVMRIFYNQPAMEWEDTFLIGNVGMNALVKGSVKKELLYLNNSEELEIDFEHSECVHNYERELVLNTAIVTVSYEIEQTIYKREYFASFSDQIIVVRYSCNEAKLSCNIPKESLSGESQIELFTCDGNVTHTVTKREIQNATTLVFIIKKKEYVVTKESYEILLKNHLKAYQDHYETIDLYLGKQNNTYTDMRIRNLLEGQIDKGVYGLFFQYTRYLLLIYFQQKENLLYYQEKSSWMNLMFGWFIHACNLFVCTNYRYETIMPMLIEQWTQKEPCRRTFSEIGWIIIELFWHYEFTNNTFFLRNVAFPMSQRIVDLLVEWQEKYPAEWNHNDFVMEQKIQKEAISCYEKICTILNKQPNTIACSNSDDIPLEHQNSAEEPNEEWKDFISLNDVIMKENRIGIYNTFNQIISKCISRNGYIKSCEGKLATLLIYSLGIATMIVQDRGSKLKFLPVLPEVFNVGYVSGMRIRDNRTIYLSWRDGAIKKCEVTRV